MLRPTPGELLAGVHRELREQVLPHVPDGEPARQLRAALHVLGRLERSWDLMPAYLEADNADIRLGITDLAGRVGATWSGSSAPAHSSGAPDGVAGDDVPGVNDPALRGLIRENAYLQAELDRVQRQWRAGGAEVDSALLALYARMAERATRAAGSGGRQ